MQQYSMTHEAPPPMPARVSAWSVYDVFTLADGEQLFIGAVSDKQFETLCGVIERPELAAEPEFATNAQRVAVRPRTARSGWARSSRTIGSTSCRRNWKPPEFPTRRSCGPISCSTIRT